MEIEGYLKKWTNFISGWKQRYFILKDGILSYQDAKHTQPKGTIHMRISEIEASPTDPLRININSGVKIINLRANSVSEKLKWLNALRASKEEIKEIDQKFTKIRKSNIRPDLLQKFIEKSSNEKKAEKEAESKEDYLKMINKTIEAIWEQQIKLDSSLNYLALQFDSKKNAGVVEILEKTANEGAELIKRVSYAVNILENEKRKVSKIGQEIQTFLNANKDSDSIKNTFKSLDILNHFDYKPKYLSESDSQEIENNSPLQSPTGGDHQKIEENGNFEVKEEKEVHLDERDQEERKEDIENINKEDNMVDQNSKEMVPILPLIVDLGINKELADFFKDICQIKYRLLGTNEIYRTIQISKDKKRINLPFFRDPNEKFNIWSIVKDSVGKDASKMAVPVYLNEPLSMLQRLAEQFEYSELLDKASETDDSALRMAYIVAFAFSPYSATTNRTKKPFNPILGETFEYLDEERNFKFLSEQVSHHPPISAGYCESKNYKYWANTNVKSQFWGKSFEFKPLGVAHCTIDKYNDHFIYTKATTTAENLLIGNMYIDNHGEMTFTNLTNNETAVLNLKKRGWNGKGAFEASGVIKDSAGNVLLNIKARWDQFLSVSRPDRDEEEIQIWKKNEDISDANRQFFFTKFTLQLNHLNEELLRNVATTDSRLRPDQRGLEYGNRDFALEEKKRLEEKQRVSRKEREEKDILWQPRWFKEEVDEITDSKTYIYKGGYWEQREKGKFEDPLDLF